MQKFSQTGLSAQTFVTGNDDRSLQPCATRKLPFRWEARPC